MKQFANFLKSLKLKKILKIEGVILAYLFGSFARGEAHPESDVDIEDKIKKILFQIATLREYEDFLHLSQIYGQFLNLKIKEL